MSRSTFTTSRAPEPAGPYSQCVRIGNVITCAGQGGAQPDGTMPGAIAAQTRQCLANVLAALAAGGAHESDIAKVNVYLSEVADFTAMNEVYASTFSEPYPARTTVYVTLPPGLLVEIDAIAVLEDQA